MSKSMKQSCNKKQLQNLKQKQTCSFKPGAIADLIHQVLKEDLTNSLDNCVSSSDMGFYVETQIKDFKKKFLLTTKGTQREEQKTAAFKKFSTILNHLSCISSDILLPDTDRRSLHGMSTFDRQLLRARAKTFDILGSFSVDEVFDKCRHGGGTTIGVTYNMCNIEDKFQFPISTTLKASRIFEQYLLYDAPLARILLHQHGGSHLKRDICFEYVDGSRFTSVEKNEDIDRIIAIEPTVNMYLQQGMMDVLVDRLRPIFDLSKQQDFHKYEAWKASITRKFGTIDFSSASDCVLVILLKFLLPPDWFQFLMAIRSPFGTLPDGTSIDLPMISTMGNATTFPLETLVFYVLGFAVTAHYENDNTLFAECEQDKCVSIYGDDCLIPTNSCDDFLSLCKYVGFLPNLEKSFWDPNESFRESCGGDYLHGRDVRPYHIRAPHNLKMSSVEPWLYIQMNRLIKKYVSYFGEETYIYHFDKMLSLFVKLFREYEFSFKFVPRDFPDDSGLHVDDFERLYRSLKSKGAKCDAILYNQIDGTYLFKYCRFNYTAKVPVCHHYRLWEALKFPAEDIPVCKTMYTTHLDIFSPISDTIYKLTVIEEDVALIKSAREDRGLSFGISKRIGGYNVKRAFSSTLDIDVKKYNIKHTKKRMH
jgi:hypothetical protein